MKQLDFWPFVIPILLLLIIAFSKVVQSEQARQAGHTTFQAVTYDQAR